MTKTRILGSMATTGVIEDTYFGINMELVASAIRKVYDNAEEILI